MIVTLAGAITAAQKLMHFHLLQTDGEPVHWFADNIQVDDNVVRVGVAVMSPADLDMFLAARRAGFTRSVAEDGQVTLVYPTVPGCVVEADPTDDVAVTPEDPEPAGDA